MNSIIAACLARAAPRDARSLPWICYPPRGGCGELASRLEAAGVEALCLGRVEGPGLAVLGKGHSSIVVAVIAGGSLRAAKIRRRDSKRESLYREGLMLEAAHRQGAAPRPYYYDEEVIVMDYVGGPHLEEAIRGDPLHAVVEGMDAARALDAAGILHMELHRPWRHVKYTWERGAAVILDYESTGEGCGNPVRLASGVLTRFPGGVGFLRVHSELFNEYYEGCSRGIYEEIKRRVVEYLRNEAGNF